MALIDEVKKTVRVDKNYYNDELNRLINSAKLDLGVAGVVLPATLDELVTTAICTYCALHFGNPPNADFLEASYREQKAQLSTNSNYTDWSGGNV